LALAMVVFLVNFVHSMRRGPAAGDDPWEGNTLEWATTSPPPPHNFHRLPRIRSERPVFDERLRKLQARRRIATPMTGEGRQRHDEDG
jgi:heme/copper-type cytochrome/quinol oxidase subunit 1